MGKESPKDAREQLIFALDVPSLTDATRLVKLLSDHVGLFKVGLELFLSGGQGLLTVLTKAAGRQALFLDLKFHDIRETVKKAQASASAWKPEYLSVHSDIGLEGLKEAASVQTKYGTKVLVVTVLTNLGPDDLESLGFAERYVKDPRKLVLLRAGLAKKAGCHGVICSGQEAKSVKEESPELIVVTPGIRPGWAAVENDDQKRKTTPRDAILAGADYIVVGRPIRDHRDGPVEAAKLIVEEIAQALKEKNSRLPKQQKMKSFQQVVTEPF